MAKRATARENSEGATARRYHLIIFQSGNQHPLAMVTRTMVREVQIQLDRVIDSTPDATEIDLWIESPGGDANAAYKLFLDLKSRASKLRIVVPDYAKSAATLLALGMDEIWMAPAAELGPLDAQIDHPEREHVQVSALEVAFSLDYLAKFSTYYIGAEAGPRIIDWTKLPRIDVLRELCSFTAQLLQPAIAKLDPTLIHRASKQLKVAQLYAETMLKSRNLPAETNSENAIRSLVDHLITDYPSHSVVVDRNEAHEWGLPVYHLEKYPRAELVREMHRRFEETLADRPEFPGLVQVIADDKIREEP